MIFCMIFSSPGPAVRLRKGLAHEEGDEKAEC